MHMTSATTTTLPGHRAAGARRNGGSGRRRLLSALLWGWLLLALSLQARAETRAWLERDGIPLGETTTLHIETDQGSAPVPDFSPLQGAFEVSGHGSSRQFEMINGVGRTRVQYSVNLRPMRGGRINLPALRVGNERTPPLALTVVGNAPAPTRAGGVVYIESESDAASPYVQQSVGYTVRLFYATQVLSGRLEQETPQGASMQRIGEDLTYQRDVGDRRYTVVERRYLLIPERSGPLAIPGARFVGQGMGGFFDNLFGDGRRSLSAEGRPRTLDVRPMPANAPQPWLPLRGLQLRYVSSPQQARVGEAAAVTIELEADGASGAQVPELELGTVDGAQVFAEPAQVEETFEKGRPRVRTVREFSIVPDRAGTLRVPAPRLEWWDADAGAPRTATLPDLALEVAPGANRAGIAPRPQDASATGVTDRVGGTRWIRVPFVQGAVHPWALATVAFALLWLATLWWALHRRARAAALPARSASNTAPASAPAAPDLRKSLAAGDLAAVADALARAAPGTARDLDAVCAQLDDPAQAAAVRALQQARWGGADAEQALPALRSAFATGPRWRKPQAQRGELLPPLYPRERH